MTTQTCLAVLPNGSCDHSIVNLFQVHEGAIGEPFYDNVPAPPRVLLARAATATACLMDTVRHSLTTDGTAPQEAFLEELIADTDR